MNENNKTIGREQALLLLDEDWYPSLKLVAERQWSTRISPDFPSSLQVEWLCEAARDAGERSLSVLYIDGSEVVGPIALPLDPAELMRFLVRHGYASVLVRVGEHAYFYKDSSDRFCIYLGSDAALNSAYKMRPSEADNAFIEWIEGAKFTEGERRSLLEFFQRYHAGRERDSSPD